MTTDFRVLGPLEVRQGAGEVPLAAAKPRVVLACLLARAGRPVTIDDLVGEVWGGSPPSSAIANLRTYVATLRRSLCSGSAAVQLLTRPGAYQLQLPPGAYRLDFEEFRALVRQGRQSLERGATLASVQQLERGLALWRGQAFGEVCNGPVVGAVAAQLEEERSHAFESLIDVRLLLGLAAEVVPVLRRAIRAEPLRERSYAQLMTALYQCGDVPGALKVFRSARQALTTELGIEPGPQLASLHRAILARSPTLQRPPVRGNGHWCASCHRPASSPPGELAAGGGRRRAQSVRSNAATLAASTAPATTTATNT